MEKDHYISPSETVRYTNHYDKDKKLTRMDITIMFPTDFKDFGEHKVVMISGRLDIVNSAKTKLKQQLSDLIEEDNQSIVIDLANVEFIDSSGIALLFKAYKDMTARKGKFALLNASNDFLQVLKISTLDRIFTIHKSYDELL